MRPTQLAAGAAAALAALAVWTAISADWSPLPALARDEALLTAFYVVAFLSAALLLRSEVERLAATVVVVLGLATLAVATPIAVWAAESPDELYWFGRLAYPVSYVNAEAALALIAFWPAIAVAARRHLPAAVRAAALAGATAMLADWVMVQSKGGGIALVASGVVFFAVCPTRLRALVPAVIAAVPVAAAVVSLTDPYRADEGALAAAARDAGALTTWLVLAAAVAGLAYALLDRRLEVPARVRRAGGAVALAALVAALASGVGAFFAEVDRPGRFFADQWEEFRELPTARTEGSHFSSLGSSRYDFWRIALDEFSEHPVAGIGARGWSVAYLEHGRSAETPERSHSLELDVLSETGFVGLALLLAGGGLALAAVWRRARASLLGAGLFAAGAYWAGHSSVDWIWTFPAVGVPAFLLLGIGASPYGDRPLPGRAAVPAGVAAAVLAVVAFAPPWLSARFVDRSYESPAGAAGDLRWARRLDPLSTDPLVAEAALARSPANIEPLERAVAREPRREDLRYLLGLAYLDAGRKAEARRELRTALRLYPSDALAREALDRAR